MCRVPLDNYKISKYQLKQYVGNMIKWIKRINSIINLIIQHILIKTLNTLNGNTLVSRLCHGIAVRFYWLCLTSHRQRGHLETAPPFTVPCEGREAR